MLSIRKRQATLEPRNDNASGVTTGTNFKEMFSLDFLDPARAAETMRQILACPLPVAPVLDIAASQAIPEW